MRRIVAVVAVLATLFAGQASLSASEDPPPESAPTTGETPAGNSLVQPRTPHGLDLSGFVPPERPEPGEAGLLLDLQVVGGFNASVTDYPFVGAVVSINILDYIQDPETAAVGLCSANLLSSEWALSAGHCFNFVDENDDGENDIWYWTMFGQSNLEQNLLDLYTFWLPEHLDNITFEFGAFGFPFELFLHPDISLSDYDGDGFEDDLFADLLLLELDFAPGAPAKPIEFNGDFLYPNEYTPAQIAGFGQLTEDQAFFTDRLQAGTTTILSKAPSGVPQSGDDFRDFCGLTAYLRAAHLCAGDLDDGIPSSCFGDSGGPLFVVRFGRPLLLGLTSTGGGDTSGTVCANKNYPTRYTNVATFSTWIRETTGVSPTMAPTCAYVGQGTRYPAFDIPCWTDQTVHTFRDVAAAWMQKGVGFLSANDITTGTSPTTFTPDAPATRGEAAAFLARFARATDGFPAHRFNDVSRPWQQQPVSWLAFFNITTGKSANRFAPDDNVTRAEFVTFLWRLAGEPGGSDDHGFVDVTGQPRWMQRPVAWAVELGITTGSPRGSTTFKPNADVTRAEVATFLQRFAERL